ncbi:MAG TPA: hypothetical protein VIH90_08550 [Candidatus Saccharimonadales bacterium]
MLPVESYKPLILLSFAILATGLSFILIKWPAGVDHTLSQHIAKRKISIIFYIVLFVIVLVPLTLFFTKWFIPNFNMSFWFSLFVWIAVISQFLCALIPEVPGWTENTHRLLAFTSATAIMPITLLIALDSTVATLPRLFAAIGLVIMIYSVVIMGKYNARHPKVLSIQASYFAIFFAVLIAATYIN